MCSSSETRNSTSRLPADAPVRTLRSSRSSAKTRRSGPRSRRWSLPGWNYSQERALCPTWCMRAVFDLPWRDRRYVKVERLRGPNPPGLVKVLSKGNYVAVVAQTEWQAIQAAQALKVTWKKPENPVLPNGYEAMYASCKSPMPTTSTVLNVGNVEKHHARREDHYSNLLLRFSIACFDDAGLLCCRRKRRRRRRSGLADRNRIGFEMPWRICSAFPAQSSGDLLSGAGGYGTNDTDDVAAEAAWIAQQIGKPVRLQWMRDEGIAWDPKGPPHVTTMRAGIDAQRQGRRVGLRCLAA